MTLILLSLVLYLIVGITAGIASGMLGIGGGTITVPALFIIFKLIELPQAYTMHLAIGTSLAAMVINTFSAAKAHHGKKSVQWNTVKRMLPGILIGSLFGGLLARYLSGIILEIFFGLFACALGLHFLRPLKPHIKEKRLPGFPLIDLCSALISGVSSILGIGGGVLTVPYLNAYRVQEKIAIGTSVAISFFISLLGSIFYLAFGLNDVGFGITFGYIYVPAFLILSVSSYVVAPYGVKLAHYLPAMTLRKYFAYAMIIIGLLMIFR